MMRKNASKSQKSNGYVCWSSCFCSYTYNRRNSPRLVTNSMQSAAGTVCCCLDYMCNFMQWSRRRKLWTGMILMEQTNIWMKKKQRVRSPYRRMKREIEKKKMSTLTIYVNHNLVVKKVSIFFYICNWKVNEKNRRKYEYIHTYWEISHSEWKKVVHQTNSREWKGMNVFSRSFFFDSRILEILAWLCLAWCVHLHFTPFYHSWFHRFFSLHLALISNTTFVGWFFFSESQYSTQQKWKYI